MTWKYSSAPQNDWSYISAESELDYCSEYLAVYNAMSNKPDATMADAQNAMVESLKASGVWSLLDVFYMFAQQYNNDGEALINWVTPGTHNAVAYNSPVFTSGEGFTGIPSDPANVYIDTNFNPTGSVHYSLDSASFGAYVRSHVSGLDCIAGAKYTSGSIIYSQLLLQYSTINALAASGSEGYGFPAYTGLLSLDRHSSSEFKQYRNGVEVATHTDPSEAIPDEPFYVLAQNDNGADDNNYGGQVASFFAGESLSANNHLNLFAAIETYLAAI